MQGNMVQKYKLTSIACIPFMLEQHPISHSDILDVLQDFLTQQMMPIIEILP